MAQQICQVFSRSRAGRLEVTHLDGDPLLSGLTSGTLLLDPES